MKPIWKWIIGVVITLIIILVAGLWYLSNHWKPIVDTQLRESVVQATDSLYQITYDELDFNLLTGNASIRNIQLTPDSLVYERLKARQAAPDNLYTLEIAHLRIRGFNAGRIVMGKRLDIDEIILDTPTVRVRSEYQAYNDTLDTTPKQTLYQRISNTLNAVKVDHIRLNNVNFRLARMQDSVLHEQAFKSINLHVHDLLIDSASQHDTTRFYHTKGIDLDAPGFVYNTPDSFYRVSFHRIQASTAKRSLVIDSLKYEPRMGRAAFYKRKKVAKDRIELSFDRIRLQDLDLQQFVRSQKIHAGHLYLDSGTVVVSNDLRYPRLTHSRIGRAPHQQLMKLSQPIKIDTMHVAGINISYSEISGKYHEEGTITFDRASGKIYNVTNDSVALAKEKMVIADLTAYLMNRGKITVRFGFDMLDKQGAHTYKGTLGPMDGKPLNKILTPLLNAEVASANIKGVSFDVTANDHHSYGPLRFDYDNMKINLLSAKDEEGSRSTKRVVSFLANSFIINDSNPDANGEYHVGKIDYYRPDQHSFFKTLWQSLLDGIKQTAGISKEREERLMGTAEAVKESRGFLRNIFKKRDRAEDED